MHFGLEKRWKSSRIGAIIILFFQSKWFGIRNTGKLHTHIGPAYDAKPDFVEDFDNPDFNG